MVYRDFYIPGGERRISEPSISMAKTAPDGVSLVGASLQLT